jgi:hypothetical protein
VKVENDPRLALLQAALGAAVPLHVHEMRKQPLDALLARGPELTQIIASHGDNILYRSKKKGESAKAFNALAEAVAILSFMPGGVTVFGCHFGSTHPEQVPT